MSVCPAEWRRPGNSLTKRRALGETEEEIFEPHPLSVPRQLVNHSSLRDSDSSKLSPIFAKNNNLSHHRVVWALLASDNREEFGKKTGPLGDKILRRILNPVAGISLKAPNIDLRAVRDLSTLTEECRVAHKEWEKFPGGISPQTLFNLKMLCFTHAIASCSPQEEMAREFSLSDK
jgi:hypothetical protein